MVTFADSPFKFPALLLLYWGFYETCVREASTTRGCHLGYADTLIPDQTPSQGDLLQFRWIRAAKLLILSFETCSKMFFLSLFTVCLRLLPFMMQNSSISLRHLRGVSRDHPRVREIKFPKFVLQNSVLRTNE